jgi:RNA polymerase sigma-70 factor (ECF subfamily)
VIFSGLARITGSMTPELQAQFQRLLEEHKRILYKVAALYSRTPADREDVAQEIVVQLWRSFPAYDASLRFSTWMYRVALNVAISALRRETVRTRHVLSDEERVLEAPDERGEGGEPAAIERLRELIEALEPLHKALVLLYVDGYSYAEIASVVGISETNVATKLGRIKAAWKRDAGAEERARRSQP